MIHYWRPARKTIAAAQEARLPLGAYPDKRFAKPGATPDTVRAMLKLGDLHHKCGTVCEIGAGSGRFAEEVIAALHPDRYEIYETAKGLAALAESAAGRRDPEVRRSHAVPDARWLDRSRACPQGLRLHRVLHHGGIAGRDGTGGASRRRRGLRHRDRLDDEVVREWVRVASFYRPIPREWVVEFMRRRGLAIRGSHFSPLPPGTTELPVFRRDSGSS